MASADASAVLARVVLTASYVAVGYAMRRFGALERADGEVMLRFVVNVTLPAMLLHTLTHTGALFGPGVPLVWLTAAFATAAVACGGALVYRRAPRYERGLLLGAMCGANLGTFAFPFVEAVWGAEGLRLAALYDVPNALVVFGAAAAVFAAEQREAKREARGAAARHDDGGVYHGEWSVTGESKQGFGVYEYPSGATYEGQWNNNQKEGFGVYRFAKGGSYAGEFRRGAFDGFGLRFMRSGGVKSGRFEEGAFVEALGMDASDAASSKAAEASKAARKAAEASKNRDESNARFASRVIAKTLTFPPFAALIIASVVASSGAPLPDALRSAIQPLAAANKPLVLLTLGVLFQPRMPKLRARTAAHFLATRYACAFAAAAVVAAAIPPSAGNARFIMPALALMPVPSVMVQYALDHEGDAALAGCLVNYSQIASLAALAALGMASAAAAAAPRWVLPAGLAAASAAVVGAGFVADGLLAPRRMVFKPGAGADEKSGEKPLAISLAPPDEGAGPAAGPTAAAAGFGSRARKNKNVYGNVSRGGIGGIGMPAIAPRLRVAPTRGRPNGVASRVASRAPSRPRGATGGGVGGFASPPRSVSASLAARVA
jgi:predicted permease